MEDASKRLLTSLPRSQKCVDHVFQFVSETPSQGLNPDQRHTIRSHVMRRHKLKEKRSREADAGQGQDARPIAILPQTTSGQVLEQTTESLESADGRYTPDVRRTVPIIDQSAFDQKQDLLLTGLKHDPKPGITTKPLSSQIHDNATPMVHPGYQQPPKKPSESYCILCGAPQSAWMKRAAWRENDSNSRALQVRRKSSSPNPSETLGAGRVDPFQTCPIKTNSQVQELMDHTITYLLPGLVPDPSNGEIHPVAKAWLKVGLQNPLVFHALVFAGSIHLDLVRWGKIYPDSVVALPHKLSVIRHLNETLGDINEASTDEIILAILILASHETVEITEEKRPPFNSPLRSAQWLNVYSAVKYVPEHMKAVMELITQRGGLEKIELAGLTDTILAGDVVAASNAISRPILPLPNKTEAWVDRGISWATSPPHPPVQKLAEAFHGLDMYGVDVESRSIFTSMGALTMAIDHYLQGKPAGLTLGGIVKIRMGIQHRILSMRETVDVSEEPTSKFNVYEACRTTALIYSYAVIFPVVNSQNILKSLVQRLQASLSSSGIEDHGPGVRNLHLWMLVLGGVAALDTPERIWFVAQLKRILEQWKIYEWRDVEEVLKSFLWLESACGLGGRLLWMEVMNKPLYLNTFG